MLTNLKVLGCYSTGKTMTCKGKTVQQWLTWLGSRLPWGGHKFNSGWTNTQGLKITEEKLLFLGNYTHRGWTVKSSRIRTINDGPRLTTFPVKQQSRTLKNPHSVKCRWGDSRCCDLLIPLSYTCLGWVGEIKTWIDGSCQRCLYKLMSDLTLGKEL